MAHNSNISALQRGASRDHPSSRETARDFAKLIINMVAGDLLRKTQFLYHLCPVLTTAITKLYYSRVIAFICVKLRALLISGPPSRMRKGRSCKFACRKRAKYCLSTRLISQKLIRWPYFFNLGKIYSSYFFNFLLFFLLWVITRFIEKIWGTGLVFKFMVKSGSSLLLCNRALQTWSMTDMYSGELT